MRKLTYLFILISFGSIAQDATYTTPYPTDEAALLWEIKGEGVEKGCYLFGTMHLIEKDMFLFPKKLEKIVSKSDKLVMELAEIPDPASSMKYITLKGRTLFDFFTEEQADSLLVWAKDKLRISEEAFRATFSQFKPFVVVQMATQMEFMGKTESYELTFQKLAKENNVELAGLETVDEQMALFDDLTDEQQSEMVMETIRHPEDGSNTTKEMMRLYNGQNVDSLYMFLQQEGGTIVEEQAHFLDDRNANWIPKIEAYIKQEKTFIAVGAGHLGGPNGLIRLLEKKGYTLKPVKL